MDWRTKGLHSRIGAPFSPTVPRVLWSIICWVLLQRYYGKGLIVSVHRRSAYARASGAHFRTCSFGGFLAYARARGAPFRACSFGRVSVEFLTLYHNLSLNIWNSMFFCWNLQNLPIWSYLFGPKKTKKKIQEIHDFEHLWQQLD